jgi:yersiniabactin nonribosomal peptide synthetase
MFQERFFSERVPHTACVNAIKEDPSGSACASLDIVEGVFQSEVVTGVFEVYSALLDLICSRDSSDWNKALSSLLPRRSPAPSVGPPLQFHPRLLSEQCTRRDSAETAILAAREGKVICVPYNRLSVIVTSLACELVNALRLGSGPATELVVAIVMEKGWEQVAAVLAVLRAHCAYLPIDARLWPEHRVKQVLQLSGAVAVLTQRHLMDSASYSWLREMERERERDGIPVVAVDAEPEPEPAADAQGVDALDVEAALERRLAELGIRSSAAGDLAYLIYTSGSTGVPKGVRCHHAGAANTVDDLNERLCVGPRDRVLALSSLSFDLSVYDIFGMLSRGAAVVVASAASLSPPDPAEWLELLQSEGVTVWNTVPALMELLVSHLEFTEQWLPPSLRVVLLSGDWIPLNLPARIQRRRGRGAGFAGAGAAALRIISLGGATEASIWSNMYELEFPPEGLGLPLQDLERATATAGATDSSHPSTYLT